MTDSAPNSGTYATTSSPAEGEERGGALELAELFLFVYADSGEVVASMVDGVGWMPLMAGDEERLKELVPMGERAASERREQVNVMRFVVDEPAHQVIPAPADGRD